LHRVPNMSHQFQSSYVPFVLTLTSICSIALTQFRYRVTISLMRLVLAEIASTKGPMFADEGATITLT
jgi:hypothetical protein